MDGLNNFIDFVGWEEEVNERVPKRYIRDQENPFNFYEQGEFKRRYRFSKEIVRDQILPLVSGRLEKNSNRGLPVSPIIQLFITLRFYATENFQMDDRDLRGISQPSVCKIIKRVSIALAEHLGEFISFPNTSLDLGGLIGEIFRYRKGLFALNVQVACGPNMEIMDIVVRHPGSTHDNVIFEQSGLRVRFENNELSFWGDNGYACKRYLLTPVNPANESEQNYTRAHISTRNIVERTFGIWKRRFPCLQRVLKTKEEISVAIICATAILHNIARNFNDNINFEINEPDNADWFNNIVIEHDGGDGLAFRRAFILTYF